MNLILFGEFVEDEGVCARGVGCFAERRVVLGAVAGNPTPKPPLWIVHSTQIRKGRNASPIEA